MACGKQLGHDMLTEPKSRLLANEQDTIKAGCQRGQTAQADQSVPHCQVGF